VHMFILSSFQVYLNIRPYSSRRKINRMSLSKSLMRKEQKRKKNELKTEGNGSWARDEVKISMGNECDAFSGCKGIEWLERAYKTT
jgi:hypothetical protein